mmetsp:Transcript_22743/g.43695  ORF Transcript_22743/g.43695 Transcript_22743/m.43695 type:complete len:1094 (-) Transcript_22743:125-3406(-)
MAIPWMPREVSSRLLRPHEHEHVKATYLMNTACVAGYLSRGDLIRPSWFDRVRLMPIRGLAPDIQEHLQAVQRVICTKVRQEVSSEPALRRTAELSPHASERPATSWQAGLLCARVIWRAIFAASAAKAPSAQNAVPVLFMACCDSMMQSCRKLLTEVWNEIQIQFTSKENRYRQIKSRPKWIVLEKMQHHVFAELGGYPLDNPNQKPGASSGTKLYASLQDYMEEVLALRFAIDWLSASMRDAQEFLDVATRRHYRRPMPKARADLTPVQQQLAALKEKSVDSFAQMWTDDAELRGVAALAARLYDGLEGPSALHFASTVTGQLLHAMWKGVQPLLAQRAAIGIGRISETHSSMGMLPPPPLSEQDEDQTQTPVYDRVAASYDPPSKECEELVSALPRGVVDSIIKVQATFRGFIFRARYYTRARSVAQYCKAKDWPLLEPRVIQVDEDSPKEKERKRRKKARRLDPGTMDDAIQDFQPNVSKYLGGEGTSAQKGVASTMGSTRGFDQTARSDATLSPSNMTRGMRSTQPEQEPEFTPAPLHIRVTADHRACADLFALYAYSMYRRRELVHMWQTLTEAYEKGMDVFAELLNRNPALKPCIDSVAAQLKRGAVVGYEKAFIAKQQKAPPGQQRVKPSDAEMFKTGKRKTAGKEGLGADGQGGLEEPTSPGGTRGTLSSAGAATQLPPPSPSKVPATLTGQLNATAGGIEATGGQDDAMQVTGEYLANYLKEMDGDDSQFKDISSSVISLATGTSPARKPPHEYILSSELQAGASGQARGGETAPGSQPRRPRLDVPFCMERVKPIWLPIKAHRFTVYRAKVLGLLPQRVLEQYVDFEKRGEYHSCIKLLESSTAGNLNVLSPATLVNNKPLLVETVLQLIVGYSGLCLRHQQGPAAVKLITQVLDNMSLALKDLHPGHRTVLEAYLYDTALSVCYFMPMDISLTDRSASFFQQASARYQRLGHVNRYCKCCLRAAAVLHGQGRRNEAEYYTQQALKELYNSPVCSLLAVTYHNLAVHTVVQDRVPDAVSHVKSYVALLRQLPKLGNASMQLMDNTQWLILKIQELWPQYQQQVNMRDSQVVEGVKPAWSSTT